MTLEEAIRSWIVSDWAFRFGPRAFQAKEAELLLDAERGLRNALTGEKGLPEAFRTLQDRPGSTNGGSGGSRPLRVRLRSP
jgi:hypothetical protein